MYQDLRFPGSQGLGTLETEFVENPVASAILTRILSSILQNLGFHLCIKGIPEVMSTFFLGGTPFFRRKLGHPGGFLGAITGKSGDPHFGISNTSQTS